MIWRHSVARNQSQSPATLESSSSPPSSTSEPSLDPNSTDWERNSLKRILTWLSPSEVLLCGRCLARLESVSSEEWQKFLLTLPPDSKCCPHITLLLSPDK